ncbi:acyltransferase family protein, partial [Vibrio sp. V01_P9A10T6]|uniref:acyltransferase family protein n=1 Tax=Vibrio sp. V01_P9A10T6 TaxID=2116368 RepID=UPI001C63B130
MTYRPQLDGLRTLAVLSVIIYHADISVFGVRFFSGGYLGVDVFFVLSGYLITKI